jgi:hypothetical protein
MDSGGVTTASSNAASVSSPRGGLDKRIIRGTLAQYTLLPSLILAPEWQFMYRTAFPNFTDTGCRPSLSGQVMPGLGYFQVFSGNQNISVGLLKCQCRPGCDLAESLAFKKVLKQHEFGWLDFWSAQMVPIG